MGHSASGVKVQKAAAVALTVALATGVTACSARPKPKPSLGGGVQATCTLFWTYQSRHGIPRYPSYAAAYKADMIEYGHPTTPGQVHDIMPDQEGLIRVTARSAVNIKTIEVAFYDKRGVETNHRFPIDVNKVLTAGLSYTVVPSTVTWGLSAITGETNASSCEVVA